MELLNSLIQQLFGLKSLTKKLIFILYLAFCQVQSPKASEPQGGAQVPVIGIFVCEGEQGGICPTLVLALRYRVCHLSWLSSSTCNQQGYL